MPPAVQNHQKTLCHSWYH